MNSTDVLIAGLYGLGAFALVEAIGFLLRRWPGLRLGGLFHLWAASLALTAALAVGAAEGPLEKIAISAAVVLGALVAYGVVDRLVLQATRSGRGPLAPKLVRDVVRVLVLLGAVLLAATLVFEYSLPAVLVSSTVLSAVLGLALQDVLKNVFAGMALELEKPIERGDWLLFDGGFAQVVDTSWRSVRLRTNDGVEIFEPNASFSASRVTNYGRGVRPVGFVIHVGLAYDAPPDRVKSALIAAARSAPGALASPPPEAFVESYGDSAIQYAVRVWTRQVDQARRFRDGVNARIWYALKREGLTVPFPIRTVRWEGVGRERRELQEAERTRARRLVGEVSLFAALPDEALDRLAASARLLRFDDGEVLVAEGEPGSSLFVVEEGRVAVSKGGDGGSSVVGVAAIGPGEFFGEMSLLTGEPRSATVTADGPCHVLEIPRSALAPLLEERPALAERLSEAVTERREEVQARLADRRPSRRKSAAGDEAVTVLQRIRTFFRLGSEG